MNIIICLIIFSLYVEYLRDLIYARNINHNLNILLKLKHIKYIFLDGAIIIIVNY